MKWIWDGGFRAHKMNEDGTRTEKVFTSSAQARQFVEKAESVVFLKPVKSIKPAQARQRRGGHSKSPAILTAEQRELRNKALARFKGL